jgi:alkanesulfonate monooxygenase SsuD/methylene tetrahydromethanopterin reductase-like flavin-dependent oxidoreductase (luciferase family)
MRFGMISEACVSKGMSYSARYHEVIKEAIFAEEMGLEFFGSSEQHFVPTGYTISAPEVLYGAIAALTSTIKLRHMSVVALKFNHPIRIAERLATLDIVSRGRVEFGTARSNNIQYLKTFGVDPTNTRSEWRETLEATLRALMESPFEFHGKHYDFDPVDVIPKLYRPRCPPVFVSASSHETHRTAGLLGIGCMTFDNWFGWEYVQECVDEYRKGLKEAQPIGGLYPINPVSSLLTFPAHCAATREQAIAESRTTVHGLFNGVGKLYLDLARGEAAAGGSGYGYLHRMEDLDLHKDDIDYMIDASPTLVIGDPDQCVERCKQLEKMGIDEVILKIDGYGHQNNLRSIEMFGKYVIPEFNHPQAIPVNDWEALGVEMEKFQL